MRLICHVRDEAVYFRTIDEKGCDKGGGNRWLCNKGSVVTVSRKSKKLRETITVFNSSLRYEDHMDNYLNCNTDIFPHEFTVKFVAMFPIGYLSSRDLSYVLSIFCS